MNDKALLREAVAKIKDLERKVTAAQIEASEMYCRANTAENERAKWERRFDTLLSWGKGA